MDKDILRWLLSGDVSIQHQARRDRLSDDRPELQQRIASEVWGVRFLAARNPNGSCGRKFYHSKWTSTHYTLLDLKTLGLDPNHAQARDSIRQITFGHKGAEKRRSLAAPGNAPGKGPFQNGRNWKIQLLEYVDGASDTAVVQWRLSNGN